MFIIIYLAFAISCFFHTFRHYLFVFCFFHTLRHMFILLHCLAVLDGALAEQKKTGIPTLTTFIMYPYNSI